MIDISSSAKELQNKIIEQSKDVYKEIGDDTELKEMFEEATLAIATQSIALTFLTNKSLIIESENIIKHSKGTLINLESIIETKVHKLVIDTVKNIFSFAISKIL